MGVGRLKRKKKMIDLERRLYFESFRGKKRSQQEESIRYRL